MSIFDSFIKLNIQKIFLNGKMDKAYKEMYKSAEEVKQLVKIRISEKFNVKRTKDAKLIILKI